MKFKNMVYPVILAPSYISELNTVTHTDEGELMLMPSKLTYRFFFRLKARFAVTNVFWMTF